MQERRLSLRRRLKKEGIRLLARLAPIFYLAWMRLVAATSRVQWRGRETMLAARDAGTHVVLAVLHQDLILSPYLFRDLGIITLANRGDAGEVITGLLERCGFRVVRGGSSRRASRRAPAVRGILGEVQRSRQRRGAIVAITPDGSRGPAGAVKPGAVFLAAKLAAEVFCLKIHASRAWYAPTWDRTAFPLPFSTITVDLEGPIRVSEDGGRIALERARLEVERTLTAMHERAFARHGRAPVPKLEANC